ncbi:hypothetical protein PtrM4_109810 [Pyrenophora tritici-repentis]|uniref:Uncharacterized protein n=1 Tax=Pyrenophora tritici-repentis TaxID=45151 RepID=A0A834RW31_9PLEO|nr:hypothetical protein A1F99_060740 [Pyrenophora tritici-repentis]KAF7570979.1 hypothetical protein PtrM4_109810 [Pyrenophora tritici-repentis]
MSSVSITSTTQLLSTLDDPCACSAVITNKRLKNGDARKPKPSAPGSHSYNPASNQNDWDMSMLKQSASSTNTANRTYKCPNADPVCELPGSANFRFPFQQRMKKF